VQPFQAKVDSKFKIKELNKTAQHAFSKGDGILKLYKIKNFRYHLNNKRTGAKKKPSASLMSYTEYTNVNTGRYLTIDVGLLYATTSLVKALCYKLTTRLRTNRWVKWFSIKQKCEHCAFARITNFDDNAEYIRFNTLILE